MEFNLDNELKKRLLLAFKTKVTIDALVDDLLTPGKNTRQTAAALKKLSALLTTGILPSSIDPSIEMAGNKTFDEYISALLDRILPKLPEDPAFTAQGKCLGEIGSLPEWLQKYPNNKREPRTGSGPKYYFRGEEALYSKLLPNLNRVPRNGGERDLYAIHGCSNIAELQIRLLYLLSRQTSQYHYDPATAGEIFHFEFYEQLCVGQHHGLPTVLLDWSPNPEVALFFAVDDPQGKFADDHGRIWVMNLKSREDRDAKNLTIRLGFDHVYKGLYEPERESLTPEQTQLREALKQPLTIVPRILTRRIDAQAGRFILWGRPEPMNQAEISADPAIVLPWSDALDYWIVPATKKEAIRAELRTVRTHCGTMYADLDGYARYFRTGGV